MTKKNEYPVVNLQHPMMIFWFLVFIAFSTFMIWLAFVIPNIWLTYLFSIFSLLTPFMLYYSLTTKVIVENNQVVKKSPFGTKALLFNEIQSFGVYKQEGKFARVMNLTKKTGSVKISFLLQTEKDIAQCHSDRKEALDFITLKNFMRL